MAQTQKATAESVPDRLPPLNWLRAFESVARLGSIKRAAEELFVTPAAVSQQVKKLEDYIGVDLLLREHRKVTLTHQGHKLREGLTEALHMMSVTVGRVRGAGYSDNCLTVACGPPFASKWLAPKLAGFLDAHSHLSVRLDARFEVVDYHESRVDIGIRLWNGDNEGLDTLILDEEVLIPLASPAYLQEHAIESAADMVRATLISDGHGVVMPNAPDWEEWFSAAGVAATPDLRRINFGDNVDQALDAAVHGVGMVLGRKTLAHEDMMAGRLASPFGPELALGRHWQIVKPRGQSRAPFVDLFEEWLTAELKETLAS